MSDQNMPDEKRRKGPAAHAIGGGLWVMVERIVSQACQVVVFIVAARLLGPAEFGAFALVAACSILLMRVAEGGWAPYILAWPGDSTVPQQVLLVAILSGVLASVLGAVAGSGLPLFGVSTQTTILVVLFAGWVSLAVTSSTQKAILIWMGRLRAASLAEICGDLAGLVVSLVALYSGQGVFSLVYGRLAFQVVQLLVSFSVTRLPPLPGLRGDDFRRMLHMSGQFFAARMIFNLRIYAATFMIGAFLGPAAVGFYRAAERLTGAVAEVVGVPTTTLGWNLFREARAADEGGTGGFQKVANVFFPVLVAVAVPLFAWLAIMGDDIVHSLLGPEWLPMLQVLQILALARLLTLVSYASEPIMSLAGRVDLLPRIALMFLGITVVCVLATAPIGLVPLAWAEVFVAFAAAINTIYCAHRFADIEWGGIFRHWLRLSLSITVGVLSLYLLKQSPLLDGINPFARAVALSLPAVLAYAAALAVFESELRQAVSARLAHRLHFKRES
ncbi:oligosaccharide flippase family protein [Aliiruegeria sabulilitoris]|uniref:oligosaccharide flippase family protein n=1 Tax=Aliiruegeria sabulilitoris TaxID=1510458 RepID=UPI0012E3E606|nr:oligosaccharide flippase family protein [Aliiruegeria sabulilitoris]NDR59017.1 oligosaccharide flippase family protein [Pseudoruegeria sp. M32A2M]